MIMSKVRKKFHIILIKPSKYDDNGYVIRWLFGVITSNSLACLYGLTRGAAESGALGDEIEPVIHVFDETFQQIKVQEISRTIRRSGDKAVACMVGVQSCQYPRAVDLAMAFKKEGLPVMIGGFHVSGSIAMLPTIQPEIQKAMDQGITIVAGEIENKWAEILKAAYEDRLQPLYNFLSETPSLAGAPGPMIPWNKYLRFFNRQASFDAGRGCPFHCSFCTIINVQGNTMRGRTADDVEKLVREQYAIGIHHFFITDDNFARHKDWEAIADRLIQLKEKEGMRLSLMIQTDMAAHRLPRFIDKMARAGVRRVFLGMESINLENLRAAGKFHNQLKEYRKLLQEWKKHNVLTFAGYIIGFPFDTYDSIMRDIDYLKRELPLDFVEFFVLTPLPGSKDHQILYNQNIAMEPDLNQYDTMHVCTEHPKMSKEELDRAYQDVWKSFYSTEHIRTILLRWSHFWPRRRIVSTTLLWFCATLRLDHMHPFLGGFFRRQGRKDRRPGMPLEPFIPYYLGRIWQMITYLGGLLSIAIEVLGITWQVNRKNDIHYTDASLVVDPPAPAAKAAAPVPQPAEKSA